MRNWLRQFLALGLILFGAELWLLVLGGNWGHYYHLTILAVSGGIALIWPLSRLIAAGAAATDALLHRRRPVTALAVALAVLLYLLLQAYQYSEQLYPKFHDEHSYLIQGHMLARGRLWMHPYPPQIAPFFDSFHLIVDRVYASIYFPGTAMMLVLGVWLGLPFWFMPALSASIAAALFFLLMEELFGGVRALIAVLMLLSLYTFRRTSLMALSESPQLLAELLLFWAFLRWRGQRQARWALLMGAVAGYSGITRPLDALCVAAAVGLALLWELRRQPRLILRTSATILLGVSPFLALQIIQNIGVTGSWHTFPSDYYVARNYPAPMLGFYHVDPAKVPQSPLPAKQAAMKQWILPAYQEHRISNLPLEWWPSRANQWSPSRLRQTLVNVLPNGTFMILLPVAFLSLWEIRRGVIVGSLVLMLLCYAAFVFYLDHYTTAMMPMFLCLILMAWDALEKSFPRVRPMIFTFLLVALGTVSVASLPQIDRTAAPLSQFLESELAANVLAAVPPPALVFFRFDPDKSNIHDEQVYNDVAWPDDAPIVRAQDLGMQRDRDLVEYYARRQPDRVVYFYDRGHRLYRNLPLSQPLGTVRQLAASYRTQP
ncbi:MAG: glycosyltransferase family 39 protein [Tepidisphaeraceae bacterium]|jgi:hypothetical protein